MVGIVAAPRFQQSNHVMQVRDSVVSDQEGDHDLVVPQRGIWGTAGIGGWNIDKCALPLGCAGADLRSCMPP